MKYLAFILAWCVNLAAAQVPNPAVTQENLQQTVCVPGWAATVRPPVAYTNRIKRQRMKAAGIPLTDAKKYELDHIIPLAAGGHPTDQKNLALQPWAGPDGATAKDVVEAAVHRRLCEGTMTLAEARACFAAPGGWKACR